MYFSIERNVNGNLEVEEKIIDKIVEYHITSATKGIKKVKATISMHHESILFILIKMTVTKKEDLVIDEAKIKSVIEESIKKNFLIRPKNIAFAYIKG
ncbi:hypothetical protein [Spiroplasma tabanidicola]|uniref:Uncharacterized protein n=1 Tax=Spiroplasma tabanidicola TaxID=324079 RepID=A0A6I6CIA7_9MOLU|nr:hypothetical protein [Spiroplasma tabanidicola]QGS51793.1 hypothetical protein STABA_v1c04300 [Spiroplasma tabanidicola]